MAKMAEAGALRAAEALLCSSGGFEVTLRLPGQAAAGNDAEQLGLATPAFQEIPVGPAVWRKLGVNEGLVLAAGAVASLVGSGSFASAESLFGSAVGVLVGGVLYGIKDAEPMTVSGAVCAYRLSLQAPVWS